MESVIVKRNCTYFIEDLTKIKSFDFVGGILQGPHQIFEIFFKTLKFFSRPHFTGIIMATRVKSDINRVIHQS